MKAENSIHKKDLIAKHEESLKNLLSTYTLGQSGNSGIKEEKDKTRSPRRICRPKPQPNLCPRNRRSSVQTLDNNNNMDPKNTNSLGQSGNNNGIKEEKEEIPSPRWIHQPKAQPNLRCLNERSLVPTLDNNDMNLKNTNALDQHGNNSEIKEEKDETQHPRWIRRPKPQPNLRPRNRSSVQTLDNNNMDPKNTNILSQSSEIKEENEEPHSPNSIHQPKAQPNLHRLNERLLVPTLDNNDMDLKNTNSLGQSGDNSEIKKENEEHNPPSWIHQPKSQPSLCRLNEMSLVPTLNNNDMDQKNTNTLDQHGNDSEIKEEKDETQHPRWIRRPKPQPNLRPRNRRSSVQTLDNNNMDPKNTNTLGQSSEIKEENEEPHSPNSIHQPKPQPMLHNLNERLLVPTLDNNDMDLKNSYTLGQNGNDGEIKEEKDETQHPRWIRRPKPQPNLCPRNRSSVQTLNNNMDPKNTKTLGQSSEIKEENEEPHSPNWIHQPQPNFRLNGGLLVPTLDNNDMDLKNTNTLGQSGNNCEIKEENEKIQPPRWICRPKPQPNLCHLNGKSSVRTLHNNDTDPKNLEKESCSMSQGSEETRVVPDMPCIESSPKSKKRNIENSDPEHPKKHLKDTAMGDGKITLNCNPSKIGSLEGEICSAIQGSKETQSVPDMLCVGSSPKSAKRINGNSDVRHLKKHLKEDTELGSGKKITLKCIPSKIGLNHLAIHRAAATKKVSCEVPLPSFLNEDMTEVELCQNALVPRLTVGENGEIIIDQESLVIKRTSAKDVTEDPSSGKNLVPRKAWTREETIQFFKALNVCGTNFILMEQLLPDRTRTQLKNKYLKEVKENKELVDKVAFKYQIMDPRRFYTFKDLSEIDCVQGKKGAKRGQEAPLDWDTMRKILNLPDDCDKAIGRLRKNAIGKIPSPPATELGH